MKKIKVGSLRFKLVVIALILIIIPITSIAFLYSQTVKSIIVNKYTQTAVQSVYEAGEKIDFILNDVQEFSSVIISNDTFLHMLNHSYDYSEDEFNTILRSFITSRDDIESINVLLRGRSYSVGATKVMNKFQTYNELEDSTGKPIWLTTQHEEIEILSGRFDKYYFSLGRKIIDFNTLEDYGVLTIDLEEIILEQSYKNLFDDRYSDIFICDAEGKIVSHRDKDKINSTITSEPYVDEIISNGTNNGFVQYLDGNIENIAIYSTLDANGWKIIKTIPTNNLYKEINEIQSYFVMGGSIYALVILLFMIIFSIRYTEPMIKMMSVIKKIEKGDLSARMEVQTHDEIGELGHGLNKMIAEMETLIDKLVKEEKIKKEVELEALHAQINPHFLYNTLNTIKWMAKIQGAKSISNAITALTKLLRISINLGQEMIPLEEEIEYVKNYIVIQKLRFNESFTIDYNIQEDCLSNELPKLILQPIVENSIIYGVEDGTENLKIQINAYKKEDNLLIEVIDNGPGMDSHIMENILRQSSDSHKFSKVGLNNVNQRIKLYFGSEFGLTIKSKREEGTKITITIPYK